MKYLLCFFLLIIPIFLLASPLDTVQIKENGTYFIKRNNLEVFKDTTGNLPLEKVQFERFNNIKDEIPNWGLSTSAYWLRFYITNKTDNDHIYLRIPYANLDEVTLFNREGGNGPFKVQRSGKIVPSSDKQIHLQNVVFEVPVKSDSTRLIYLKIKSREPIIVPIFTGNPIEILKTVTRDNVIFGAYIGVILIMLLYNMFIFFSVRDKDYLTYVIYVLSIGITQICIMGYGDAYLWPDSLYIKTHNVLWTGALSGIATAIFSKSFLKTKENLPLADKLLNVFILLEMSGLFLSFMEFSRLSYKLINTIALTGSIFVLVISTRLIIKGFKPAKYFTIALSFFFLSVIGYVLLTKNLLPYTILTKNILLIGSTIEITLLSFALADKINVYRKEKEISQELAIQAAREKEDYIKKENIILENKINTRTSELQKTNGLLNDALNQLKNTQSKLIEVEKMSSLGQLTAGIAHEINNPINFVKSSITPLKMDIKDILVLLSKYEDLDENNLREKIKEAENLKKEIDLEFVKEEIEQLLTGIDEGAERTANIVKELRTFSRLDEQTLKEISIPEALDATLMLVKHIIPRNLTVLKHYNAYEPIECYPGKINQALMNIITNAIQAITSETDDKEEQLILGTDRQDAEYLISIRDTGPGIPAHIREKIFDPFFTTKGVGEGTGLGLSIAFNIVETHKGRIEVHSEEGKGTDFLIFLPLKQVV